MNKEESAMDNDKDVDDVESVIQVMLDDDQCLTLEEKGRVLLEQDSRFFLLDNVGLQEITKQNDFIEQLREEHVSVCRDKENDIEILPETLRAMGELPYLDIGQSGAMITPFVESLEEENSDQGSDGVEGMDTNNKGEVSTVSQCNNIPHTESTNNRRRESNQNLHVEELLKEESSEENVDQTVTSIDRNLEPLMTIPMDYVIEELPPKLYIGQSHDGKKLYASLRKFIPAPQKTSVPVQKRNRSKSQSKMSLSKLVRINTDNTTRPNLQRSLNSTPNKTRIVNFDEKKFQTCKLSDEAMSSDPEDISYLLAALWYTDFSTTAVNEHLTLIEKTVDSLMQLVSVKELIVGQNVIVTKVVKFGNGDVNVPFVVTGFISDVSGESENENWRFIYMPELLMENNKDHTRECRGSSNRLLHIAIVETPSDLHSTTNYTTNVLVVYKSFTKLARELQNNSALQSSSSPANVRRMMRLKVLSSHACAACGATFNTEPELSQHQETHKLEVKTEEPPPIIDENNTLKILENSKIILNEPQYSKMFVCYYCKKVFNRCSNLQRHMSIHFDPVVKTDAGEPTKTFEIQKSAEVLGQSKGVFTCNMCTCSYFYASTLTRHIMTCHIDPTKTKKHIGEVLQEF